MILGPVTLLDCAAFVLFFIPQLFYQVGVGDALLTVVKVLPFLVVHLPYQLSKERWFTPKREQAPFVRRATMFEDVVIRCVRYAFANVPARVGRVFLCREVVYPFFRFRLFRSGYSTCPVVVKEVHERGIRGVWISHDVLEKPDVVIYYCHGGGFSMGSVYFYLEFLIAWVTRLKERGFRNPAIFALEYTLVPEGVWPKQFTETCVGYNLVADYLGDSSRICVSGDSAGATLVLSRLLHHGNLESVMWEKANRPGLAVLISPWTHLVSDLNRNTASDYLDAQALELYGSQYLDGESADNDIISPGLNRDGWRSAMPSRGYCIVYGAEEVFAPGIEEAVQHIRQDGALVEAKSEPDAIHAWPVVNLFLGSTRAERLKGLDQITEMVVSRMKTP